MPSVLTMDSIVNCGVLVPAPPLHGGKVLIASIAKLKVNGKPVLMKTSIHGKQISDCKSPTDPNTGQKLCSNVLSVITGEATKLKVNRQPVMLDTVTGTTDGVPPGTLLGTANQPKLTAV